MADKSLQKEISPSQNAKSGTRISKLIYGLGTAINNDDARITGSRLPNCNQVLRCMMWHIQEGTSERRSKWEAAKLVMAQLETFYQKANIPLISEKKALQRIIALSDENAKMRAIPKNRRDLPSSQEKLRKMQFKLQETFAIWPCNVEQLMKNQEDLAFLHSMKTDRKATFGALDKPNAAKEKRKEARLSAENGRKRKYEEQASTSQKISTVLSDSEYSDDDETFEQSAKQQSHKRVKKTGTSVFIPHDILKRPKLVSLSTRMKLTPSQQAAFTQCVIEEAGGNSESIAISYATADRSRRQMAKQISTSTKDNWEPPKMLTVHWDSKLTLSVMTPNKSEERLAVSVGNSHDSKLLGVPSYTPGSGQSCGSIISELTCNLLEEWKCIDQVVNMAFDTTASNTGHISAACISIQEKVGRALLWSACRHHVGEVVLDHVFTDLKIEASKSPEVSLFSRFKKNFSLLPESQPQDWCRLDVTTYSVAAQKVICSLRDDAVQVAQSNLQQKRDDYLEFVELSLVFLDGYPEDRPFSFKQLGAMHRARWMAKVLYSIKISLLQNQIAQLATGKITSRHQPEKIRDFVTFVALIYSSWWLQCSVAIDAPWNDLQFFKNLLQYSQVSALISKSAVKAFERHLWYLTAEMVPLALFSSKVPAEHKASLATSLLAVKTSGPCTHPNDRYGSGFGKPKFPEKITPRTTLSELVGPDSWYFFHILQLDPAFLTTDVSTWPAHPAYKEALINLEAINVVNDSAERNVKLSTDFIGSARSEEHYQNVLQVVEADRKEKPNLRHRKEKV